MNTGLLQQVLAGHAPPLFPISVDQLHLMQTQGILPPEQPVELINGTLVRKNRSYQGEDPMVHNPGHAGAVSHVHRMLDRYAEQHGCHARSQLPLTLDDENEPEPDIAVVVGDPQTYWHEHPRPAHVQLVVEVSHSTLQYDRTTKLQLYAAAGIPRYWIVNLIDHQLECFWMPAAGKPDYAQRAVFVSGDTCSLTLPGGEVPFVFEDLLPAMFRGG